MVYCLCVSTLTILIQICISHILRKQICERINHALLQAALNEFVASAELCGTCFELIIVADNYGLLAYCAYLFAMTIWWSRDWGSATACSYNLLEEYVEQGGSWVSLAINTAAQIAGAIISFRWIKQLWLMELAHTHHGRGIDDCSADLHVPVMWGFVIECVLTCSCRLVSRTLGILQPKYATAIDSFFATLMVALAFDYSGGYFNPVLATGLKWGCDGHTFSEHIIVYWAGATFGSMLSIKLWNVKQLRQPLLAAFSVKEVAEVNGKKED